MIITDWITEWWRLHFLWPTIFFYLILCNYRSHRIDNQGSRCLTKHICGQRGCQLFFWNVSNIFFILNAFLKCFIFGFFPEGWVSQNPSLSSLIIEERFFRSGMARRVEWSALEVVRVRDEAGKGFNGSNRIIRAWLCRSSPGEGE